MPEVMSDRRRVPRGTDRRQTQRVRAGFDAHLLLDICFLDADAVHADDQPLDFFGSTRDLSEAGLGIIIPAVRLDERACAEQRAIKITIHLPRGPVEVGAVSVYCAPLDQGQPDDGCLFGAKLSELGNDLREFLLASSNKG